MKPRTTVSILTFALLVLLDRSGSAQAPASADARSSVMDHPWRIELEGGALWQSRNDVQIPGNTGTRFSIADLIGSGPYPAGRLTLDWDATERHGFRFVYAPQSVDGNGTLAGPTDFDGSTFAPGPAYSSYRFDTYRLTWRYRFWQSERWTWRVGLTGLLRDAEIELRQGGTYASNSNTGFVPLIHLAGDWRFADRWNLSAELDGAAASQGRAFDFALKAGYEVSDRWRIAGGYRTIEGGSDGDDVYTFAWFHALVVSVTFGF